MAGCMGASMASVPPCPWATAACGNREGEARDPTGALRSITSQHASASERTVVHRPPQPTPAVNPPASSAELSAEGTTPLGVAPGLETATPPPDLDPDHSRPTPLSLGIAPLHSSSLATLRGLPTGLTSPRDASFPAERRPARERILAAVAEHSGLTFSDLRRILGLATGTITRHLRTLESTGALSSVRVGARRRYYVGSRGGDSPSFRLEPTQALIVDLLRSSPGASQADLALRLALPRQNVHYAVRRLVQLGIVRFGPPSGARRPCFLSPEASRSVLFPLAGRKS